jgi:hypothetical protein
MIELVAQAGFVTLAVASAGQAILRRWSSRLKSTTVPPPSPAPHVEPKFSSSPSLEIGQAAALGRGANDGSARRFIDDGAGGGHWERTARHRRSDLAPAKIVELFVQWMIAEEYSGFYTSGQIYEAYKEFAWSERLEELDRGSFLAQIVEAEGVLKKRPYVQKNETYRHLRPFVHGRDRVTVYRIPTAAELAAVKHKRTLREAEARRGMRVPKVRLEPGGHKPPRTAPAAENPVLNNELDVSHVAFDEAA